MKNWIVDWIKDQITPQNSKNVEGKIAYIDFAKILAAWMVCFYHFSFYKLDYEFQAGSAYSPNLNRLFMSLCACSVPIFFIINGELMFKKHRALQSVWLKALKTAIMIGVWSFFSFPAWFFRTLMIVYLIFPALQYLLEKKKWLYYFLGGLLLIYPFFYNFILLLLKAIGIEELGGINIGNLGVTGLFTMYGILYFMIGSGTGIIKRQHLLINVTEVILGYFLVIFECTFYTNYNQLMYDGVNAQFPTLGAMLLAVGIYGICSKVNFNKYSKLQQIISKCGQAVLPIYLLHMCVIITIEKLIGTGIQISLITAIIGTTLICISCGIIGAIARKIPVLCALFKI